MSTFLELTQDLRREVGISGTGPASVLGNTGELERLVNWIKNAYIEIQNRHGGNWRFMRSDFTIDTTVGQDEYVFSDFTDIADASAISRFSSWRFKEYRNPPKIFLTSAGVGGQTWMSSVRFDPFENIYSIGTQNDARPFHITITPQDSVKIGPAPSEIYTVTGEYYKSAQILAADSDVPEMPPQFHQLIVYEAMKKYAGFESAPEVMARAHAEGNRVMRQLEVNQHERMRKARPMA